MNKAAPWMDRFDAALTRNSRWLFVLFGVSFALKLLYVIQSADALHVAVPIMDSEYYDRMAQRILEGQVAQDRAFFMGPLYPYFLAVVYAVLGHSIAAVRIIQAVGGAATVVMAYLLGVRFFRPTIAFVAAVMLLFYGTATFFEGQLLMTWLGTFLNMALLLTLTREKESPWKYVLAGALLGLSALARANVLVMLPVVLMWFFMRRDARRVRHAGLFTAAMVIAILPVTVHNIVASKSFVPVTSNGGVNFYIGNSAQATGIFYPPKGINIVDDESIERHVERLVGREMTDAELSRYWYDESFAYIRSNPAPYARLLARKTAMFFNGYEVPQIESFDAARREHATLRMFFFPFWAILVLGLVGVVATIRAWRRNFLLLGYVLAFSLSIILFFVTSRYRVQIVPVLSLFAAHALLMTLPQIARSLRRSVLPIGLFIALIVLTRPSLFALPPQDVEWRELTHRARRLSRIGEHTAALGEIAKAIEIHPDNPDSYLQRAVIHKGNGDLFRAIEDYSRALDLDYDMPTVHYDLGQTLRQAKMYGPAIRSYEAAVTLDPRMLEAYNNLGIAYREMKNHEKAIESFQKVIDRDPTYTKAYNNLGASLAELGHLDEAATVFEKAITVDPTYPNSYKNLAMVTIQRKDVDRAVSLLSRYLELKPGDEHAQSVMKQLRVAVEADSTRLEQP